MREPFLDLTAIAAVMPQANINTDAIIPAAYLRTARADLGRGLFGSWRYHEDGRENPDFILNRQPFRRAKILFAGENFGCGSSREAAAWALMQFGIRCVFAPSFADIFYENAFRNGLLAGRIEPEIIAALAESADGRADHIFAVDLQNGAIAGPGGLAIPFSVAEARRDALIRGDDEIDATMRLSADISAYLAEATRDKPWLYRGVGKETELP